MIRTSLIGVTAMIGLAACNAQEATRPFESGSTLQDVTSTTIVSTAPVLTSTTSTAAVDDGVEPPTARDIRLAAPTFLPVGEPRPVQIWDSCGVYLNIGDERYVPDRWIAPRIQHRYPLEYRESDFPPEWQVVIFNEAASDGPDWVILDALVERLDDATLEVRHEGTGQQIAMFNRDLTPDSEIGRCG